jgi:hypothetical protein
MGPSRAVGELAVTSPSGTLRRQLTPMVAPSGGIGSAGWRPERWRVNRLLLIAALVGSAGRLDHVPARAGARIDMAPSVMQPLAARPGTAPGASGAARRAHAGSPDVRALVPREAEPTQVLVASPATKSSRYRAASRSSLRQTRAPPAGLLRAARGDPERPRMPQVKVARGRGRDAVRGSWDRSAHEFWFISAPATPSWHFTRSMAKLLCVYCGSSQATRRALLRGRRGRRQGHGRARLGPGLRGRQRGHDGLRGTQAVKACRRPRRRRHPRVHEAERELAYDQRGRARSRSTR